MHINQYRITSSVIGHGSTCDDGRMRKYLSVATAINRSTWSILNLATNTGSIIDDNAVISVTMDTQHCRANYFTGVVHGIQHIFGCHD